MSVVGVEILEAEMPIYFRSLDRLREHVEKHLLCGGREEQWRALIDNAWLGEARAEFRGSGYGEACRELGNAYETLLGAKLAKLCRDGRGHAHFATLTEDAEFALGQKPAAPETIDGQAIEAWESDAKLFISANRFVRKDGWTRYFITTGYRVHVELGRERFARKAAENMAEKKRRRRMGSRLMAIHDSIGNEE